MTANILMLTERPIFQVMLYSKYSNVMWDSSIQSTHRKGISKMLKDNFILTFL